MPASFFLKSRPKCHQNTSIQFKTTAMAVAVLLAVLTPSSGSAQQPTQTHRILAQDMNFTPGKHIDVQGNIWKDFLPKFSKLQEDDQKFDHIKPDYTNTVFVASFKDGRRTIILSSIAFECQNVSSAAPYWTSCPARIAVIEHGKAPIIRNIPNLVMSSDGDPDKDLLAENNNFQHQTIATFNSAKQQISTELEDHGKRLHSQTFDLKSGPAQ